MKNKEMQSNMAEKKSENDVIKDINAVNDVKAPENHKDANAKDAERDAKAKEVKEYKSEKREAVKEEFCEPVYELGIISEGTRVEGNIEAKGNLTIGGTVDGNVTATGNVIITGNVKGIIKCKDLVLENCNLTAEIKASGDVSIEHGTVNGNVLCKNIKVAGKVNGNIDASGTVALLDGAAVRGDIKAARMGMDFGAFVDGKIMMAMPYK